MMTHIVDALISFKAKFYTFIANRDFGGTKSVLNVMLLTPQSAPPPPPPSHSHYTRILLCTVLFCSISLIAFFARAFSVCGDCKLNQP